MFEATNYRYGVIRTLDEAREAAADAESEGLLGWYPAACVVLERELKRWEAAHAEWLTQAPSKSLNALAADLLRPYLKPGQKVIWREAFRWHDDNGVLSNHYDGMELPALAEDFGYDWEYSFDFKHAAIVWKKDAANGVPVVQPQRHEEVQRLLFDIRGAMLRYGTAFKKDDQDGIRSTTTEACELLDKLAALANGVTEVPKNG